MTSGLLFFGYPPIPTGWVNAAGRPYAARAAGIFSETYAATK
jgi:hypothetical protein